MFMSKKKKAEKEKQDLLEQLEKDRTACKAEIAPILAKYNLVIRGRLVKYDDGMVAFGILDRVPEDVQTDSSAAPKKTKSESTPA